MATEIANAYIALTTKMPGVQKDIATAIGGEATGRKQGGKLMAGIKKAAKVGAVAVGASLAVAGTAGFKAAAGIETAEKTLTGLYGSAKDAKNVMAGLRDVAKDSPIDYQAYLKAGESLAYAGVKGDEAVDTLRNVGLAITAAGGSSEDMNRATDAVLKMVNAGKVSLDALQQLSDAGVPIISGLADHFGVSMDEINKMASSGAIGLDDVTSVMASGTGDIFQSMLKAGEGASQSFGNQWKIAVDNVSSSLGALLVPILQKLAPVLNTVQQAVTKFLDEMKSGEGAGGKLADILKTIWDVISNVFGFISSNIGVISTLAVIIGTVVGVLKAAAIAQGILNAVMLANPVLLIVAAIAALVAGLVWFFTQTELGQEIWANFTQFLSEAWANISQFFIDTWTTISTVFMDVWNGIVAFFQTVWNFIVTFVTTYIQIVLTIWTTVWTAISTVFTNIWNGIVAVFQFIWSAIVTYVTTYITIVKTIITTVVNVIMTVWNTVWNGIKSFFVTIWNGIVTGVKTYINIVKTVITTVINVVKSVWSSVWGGIKSFFTGIWNGIVSTVQKFSSVFRSVFGGIKGFIKSAFSGVIGVVKAPINGIIGLINGAIGALNKLSVTIPDWVPLVGGQTWGLSLPKIPKLADGATVMPRAGGTLAVLAEAGKPETVVDTGMMNELIERILNGNVGGGAGGAQIHVEANDPMVTARVVAEYLRAA